MHFRMQSGAVSGWFYCCKEEWNKDGNNISLILQHNTRDEEEKQGTAVKMTMWNLMLEEERCFEQKHPETSGPPNFKYKDNDPDSVNWKPLIPR